MTLQGEGMQAGCPAVFCRFSGCNLWNGREADRAGAVCCFCDTDFVGTDGQSCGWFDGTERLADAIAGAWQGGMDNRLAVLTGGEPLLQLDEPLIAAPHARHLRIAVETNGTLAAPLDLDWICVSPKASAPLALCSGDELKAGFSAGRRRAGKF